MNVQAQQTEYAKQGLDYTEQMKQAFADKYERADITGVVEEAEKKLKELVEKYGGEVDESLSLFENLNKAQADLETKKVELATQITDLQTANATILQIIDNYMQKQLEDAEALYQEARDTGELKIMYENQYQEELQITRDKIEENASKVHQMLNDMREMVTLWREMQGESHKNYD
jgi:t-SNARE complex subunit (syntaxin)